MARAQEPVGCSSGAKKQLMASKIPPGMGGEVPSGQEKPVGRGVGTCATNSLGSSEYWPKGNSGRRPSGLGSNPSSAV